MKYYLFDFKKFYGYLILNCASSAVSWILSVYLVYIECCKTLPSIPTRGHGLILLVFWTSEFIIENLSIISFKSPEWFWNVNRYIL
jgi:ATP-binding cassette subfamily B (MDR/TAP) protein 6